MNDFRLVHLITDIKTHTQEFKCKLQHPGFCQSTQLYEKRSDYNRMLHMRLYVAVSSLTKAKDSFVLTISASTNLHPLRQNKYAIIANAVSGEGQFWKSDARGYFRVQKTNGWFIGRLD